MFSCAKDPSPPFEPEDGQITSIAALKLLYKGYPVQIKGEIYLRGGIISSNQEGNFYNSLIIEDSTGGMEIKIRLADSFRKYPRGSTVTINCNGLTLGSYGGALQIGGSPNAEWETDVLAPEKLPLHIQLSSRPEQAIPAHKLRIDELSARYVNCWVRIEDVQFVDEEIGLTWGDADAATNRHLKDSQGNILPVRIEASCRFAGIPLPQGSGYIEGVLGYFNGYQIRPISTAEISMRQPRF